ncbi:MAG: hypothetical protein CMB67_00645 [Euryarchaeota archaeon]|nr:hypothetical protein [Euryarchaeota archaeon]
MLRTMVGTGLTLILLLSFAVYSNTVDSEYYEYTTTNEGKSMQLTAESEGQSDWFFSTNDAITWVNFSVEDAPPGSSLTIEAEGTNWSHSPSLGLEDQTYICNEPDSDYESIIETCEYSRIHSIDLNDGNGILRGRVSLDLPIRGKGYLESESFESAQVESNDLIRSAKKVITWKITIEKDGDIVSSAGILIEAEYTTHELLDIQQFKLDPFQETVYSFSALVGCFFLVLVIPLMIYFSARYREKMNEQIRTSKE